jgi:mono/diheme cytochrome c family protein
MGSREQRGAASLAARGVGLAAVVVALAAASCDSPERREARTAKAIYEANCAVCHGSRIHHEDPQVVEATGEVAPDLRTLERRLGPPFPRAYVTAIIDGRVDVAAHGPRAMPVWGDRLYADWPAGEDREKARAGTIELLVDYIESIQVD